MSKSFETIIGDCDSSILHRILVLHSYIMLEERMEEEYKNFIYEEILQFDCLSTIQF